VISANGPHGHQSPRRRRLRRRHHGNLSGEPATTPRAVSSDTSNDLALLQGPAASFKSFAKIRDRSIRSGDSVVAIGYPYHGLLSSDFTVTTGIVSSLSGIMNDMRYLQISAAVQPGDSGGPRLDTGGLIIGMVAMKLDALKMGRATATFRKTSISLSRPA